MEGLIGEGAGGFRDTRFVVPAALHERSYGKALLALARENPNVVCLGADLSQPTQTDLFRDELGERFTMLGIQEANMVGVAGGMARAGDIPFAHSFCVFITRRVYDQVAMQAAYPNLPVKLVGFMPGLATELGVSHQAIDDVALMRALPNMVVLEPSGPEQIGAAVRAAAAHPGPVYLRLSIERRPPDESMPLVPLEIGRGHVVKAGRDVAILAAGGMVRAALEAAEALEAVGMSASVANMASLKPLDRDLVVQMATSHRVLVTAENHSRIGGLGSAVAEVLALEGLSPAFGMVALDDVFAEGASMDYLLEKHAMRAVDIADLARRLELRVS